MSVHQTKDYLLLTTLLSKLMPRRAQKTGRFETSLSFFRRDKLVWMPALTTDSTFKSKMQRGLLLVWNAPNVAVGVVFLRLDHRYFSFPFNPNGPLRLQVEANREGNDDLGRSTFLTDLRKYLNLPILDPLDIFHPISTNFPTCIPFLRL